MKTLVIAPSVALGDGQGGYRVIQWLGVTSPLTLEMANMFDPTLSAIHCKANSCNRSSNSMLSQSIKTAVITIFQTLCYLNLKLH